MKSLLALFSLVAISSTAFAGGITPRCEKEILQVAQMNLDLKAKMYNVGDTFGNIRDGSLEYIQESKDKKHITAKLGATIHLVEIYEVEITMDDYCTPEKIVINDLGER